MAADNAAKMPIEPSNGDGADSRTRAAGPNDWDALDPSPDSAEQHDLTFLRMRRARANDPRRSLNAAFSNRPEPATPVALRRAPMPPPPEPKTEHRSRTFWFLSAALFALVAGATFAVFYFHQTLAARASVAPEVIRATVPASSLQMHVEAQGERVLVSWNPRASGVQSASGGLLTIEDAGQRRELSLDASQAANGSVLYRPASGDVTFRLQIRNAAGAVFSDSLRVLDPAKAALAEQMHPALNRSPATQRAASRSTPKRIAAPARANRVGRLEALNNAPLILSNPRVQDAHSNRVDPPQNMPQSPAIPTSGAPGTAGSTPLPIIGQATPPSTPARNTAAPPVGTVSIVQDKSIVAPHTSAGGFIPPQAITQVMPVLRSSLRAELRPGTRVEVSVHIDSHGRVKRARVMGDLENVDIGIQRAAVNAAKQWKFMPARLNGKRVDSEHTIVFRFQPATR